VEPPESAFAGGDARYLRENQYATSTKLSDRGQIHERFSTAPKTMFEHLSQHTPWDQAHDILDIGCGPGWWWDVAAHRLRADAHVTVADLSAGMVQEAVGRLSQLGRTVTGRPADAAALPFAHESFDLVAAHYMLYHVPDPRDALREFHRVLRPGGTLVAATNGPSHMGEFFHVLSTVFGPDIVAYEVNHRFPPFEGLAMLNEVFSSVEWFPHEDSLNITDLDAALRYLRSFPPGETATETEVDALRRELAHAAVDGVLVVGKETGLFVATKSASAAG
jgi:ubiquinone/menaquinone biosynthesis C-methylase UbiE